MKRVVYIETTIVSYLAAKPSRNVVIAGQQHVTAQWWSRRRSAFELVASEAVAFEAMRGDALAAAKRGAYLAELRSVPLDETVASLARRLISGGRAPRKGSSGRGACGRRSDRECGLPADLELSPYRERDTTSTYRIYLQDRRFSTHGDLHAR